MHERTRLFWLFLTAGALVGGIALAAPFGGVPNEFQRDTAISADNMNANFEAMRTYINQLEARVAAFETGGASREEPVVFSAWLSAHQDVPSSTPHPIKFDMVSMDSAEGYDAESGVWTAPRGGWYHIILNIGYADFSTGRASGTVLVNGEPVSLVSLPGNSSGVGGTYMHMGVGNAVHLAAGDEVSASTSHQFGASRQLEGVRYATYLRIVSHSFDPATE